MWGWALRREGESWGHKGRAGGRCKDPPQADSTATQEGDHSRTTLGSTSPPPPPPPLAPQPPAPCWTPLPGRPVHCALPSESREGGVKNKYMEGGKAAEPYFDSHCLLFRHRERLEIDILNVTSNPFPSFDLGIRLWCCFY